ncbi:hypothetical protein D0T11_10710 [Hymenobacter rubripertinctus]|uniref:Uncharacterized protein n=1 Tax=Hymenobacter rubripertinctus TaxID=2029981 RepID=A0A418QXY8_9BACT|nr:hypothetical protein D0T11_10710 [Hymenobacter rubripertinctus]
MFCRWLACLLAFALFQLPVHGQTTPSALLPAADTSTVLRLYDDAFGAHSQLYNGPEYVEYAKQGSRQIGHPFFLIPEVQPGTVHYNGHLFQQTRLKYDALLDQVVLAQNTSPLLVRLVDEKLTYFTINNHYFIRILADSSAKNTLATGYYEVLLRDKPISVLARRAKKIQKNIANQTVIIEYLADEKLFARKDGRYYPIRSKRSVYNLFKDHISEVRIYMRKNKLKLKKKSFESDFLALSNFYNSLLLP